MNTSWFLDIRSVPADDAFQIVIAWIRHVVCIIVHAVVFVLADFRIWGGYNSRKFVRNDITMGIATVTTNNHYNIAIDTNSRVTKPSFFWAWICNLYPDERVNV